MLGVLAVVDEVGKVIRVQFTESDLLAGNIHAKTQMHKEKTGGSGYCFRF